MSKYLVTSGLPYANGKLHIGHLAGAYLPADVYVRFLKLNKEDVIYICGTDEHGAPISIRAEAENKTSQEIVDFYHESIKKSFAGVNIEFDNFSGTARPEHHKLSQEFFINLLKNSFINTHNTKQMYCEHDKRFLPDRYVEGECPYCHASGARGDQCDACGKLLDADELVNPACKICSNTPVIRETKHWFLDLPAFAEKLKHWLDEKTNWKDNVKKFILSWIEEGLIERSITRDINWGVPVPEYSGDKAISSEDIKGKVLYVWFDAPIGYISSTVEWAKNLGQPDKWKEYWLNPECRIVHFIGKDNIPFHAIIWPSLLMGQEENYTLPWDIPANEYLTLEGEKISTSKDWAIWVEDFLKYFDGELLRFALCANAPESKDADFAWKDFQALVNNSLANVLGNLANRVYAFTKKNFNSKLELVNPLSEKHQEFLENINNTCREIHQAYTEFKIRKVVKNIIDLAREGNRFFDEAKPWQLIKEDKQASEEILFVCAELLRKISICFYPIIPESMIKLRKMSNLDLNLSWEDIYTNSKSFEIGDIEPLFKKIEDKEVQEQIDILYSKAKHNKETDKVLDIPAKDPIEFEDFCKIDLRVVKILKAEKIKKSKKLLKLQIKCGSETRQVLAGIAESWQAEDLIGKSVVMLFNLKPRQMMGELSEGMILAAEDSDGKSVPLTTLTQVNDGAVIS